MTVTAAHHAEPGDKFSAYVTGDIPYAVVKIYNAMNGEDITIFTPHGINHALDYLTEMRDALQGAIDELTQRDEALQPEEAE